MPLFKYSAINEVGRNASGELDASNDVDLERRLEQMGLTLIHCKESKPGRSPFSRGKVTRKDVINFCFDMEQLTRSGVPLLDGLGDIRDSTDNFRLREIIGSLVNDIEGGKMLSEAMQSYPGVFDQIFISLIRAGEESGSLPDIFLNLTRSLKWQDELIAKTKNILFYPAFVGLVVGGVAIFLMVYLVPKLTEFIIEMGGVLPGYTRALIATSNFVSAYWYALILLPVLAWLMLRIITSQSADARYRYDAFKLRIWVIGPILEKVILSRMTDLFAMMYRAGLPLLEIIDINKGVTGNLVIGGALEQIRQNIAQGASISAAFAQVGIFPALVNRMVRVGETTGELDKSLVNVSYFFNRQVEEQINRLQTLMGPILILFLAAILGWIMVSVIFPIYDMMGEIQA